MQSIYLTYIDTRCFIYLGDLKYLPWRELLPNAASIDMLIAPAVVGKLDRRKVSRNGKRRCDRSWAALDLIEAASLRHSPSGRIDWNRWRVLDPTRADNPLAAAHIHLIGASTGGRRVQSTTWVMGTSLRDGRRKTLLRHSTRHGTPIRTLTLRSGRDRMIDLSIHKM